MIRPSAAAKTAPATLLAQEALRAKQQIAAAKQREEEALADGPVLDPEAASESIPAMAADAPGFSGEAVHLAQAAATTGVSDAAPAAAGAAAGGGVSPLLILGAGLGLAAAAASSGSDNPPAAPQATFDGKAIDGYLAGATVFVDMDGDGQLDAEEPRDTTDADGDFTLPDVAGEIIAFGGRDIATGLDFIGVLKAPSGSTVVTPLTTLMAQRMAAGEDAETAQAAVLDALGLGELDVDLANFDPVAAATGGDEDALALHKAGVAVAALVAQVTEQARDAAGGGDRQDIAAEVFALLADRLTDGALQGGNLGEAGGGLLDALGERGNVGGRPLDADALDDARAFVVETMNGLAEKLEESEDLAGIGDAQKDAQDAVYTLQLLHLSDAEAGMLASSTAPNLAALADAFEDAYANSITLAGGDNFIPGPFLAAGTDAGVRDEFNTVTGSNVTGTMNIAAVDIALHNLIGVEASALGNHDFDLGSNVLKTAITSTASYVGAQFPFISANLDFSADSDLNPLFVNTPATAGLENAAALKGKIAPSAILNEGGAKIGLVGATTQILQNISSPSGTVVKDNDGVRSDDMDLLAAQLQPVIDDLIAQGVNKIILMAHLQLIGNEKLLASKLSGVDIILSAGSNTRLGDANDTAVAFPGHAANFADAYPLVIQDKDGNNTLVVNTDNEFTYLGRLVVDFDAQGEIVLDSLAANAGVNGAYAATAANVAEAWNTTVDNLAATAFAAGTRGDKVQTLTDAVQDVIDLKDGNIYGHSDVYLEGERIAVRNQETNLGNLSADANAYAAELALGTAAADTYIVSLKNGGGIRAQIGTISAPDPVDGTVDKLPPEGGVSQLDVENSLRFNNQLMIFDTTAEGLKAILEHGVASLGNQGRFPQLGGVAFSYDPDLPAGSRISDIALSGDGYTVNLYNDGVKQADAPTTISVVTLSFLANGGDSYPIKAHGENFRYLIEQADGAYTLTAAVDEALNFTAAASVPGGLTPLGEQAAFAAYMEAFHATPATAYDQADTPMALDTRIQNLNVRAEDVLAPVLSFVGPDSGFDLANYFLIGRYALPVDPAAANKLAHESSAITYNKDTDSLFVVGDGGTAIVQIDKQGVLIDSMALAAGSSPQGTYFYDTEGLTYVGEGRFVLVEERYRQLNEFTYTAGTTLGGASGVRTVKLGTSIGNVGIEGLSYDPMTGGFLLAKEATPQGIFQTTADFATGAASNGSAATVNSINLFDPALAGMTSFNDVFALSNLLPAGAAGYEHFLLLGAADGLLRMMDRSGNLLGTLNVGSVAKNEGVTMDAQGNIYVVGEEGGGSLDKPEMLVYAPTRASDAVGLGSHLYITFNSAVSAGTGHFILDNGAGDSRSISVSDANQVDIDGATVTLNPTADLLAGTAYSLTFAAGVLNDAGGNAIRAVDGNTLRFTTVGDVLAPSLIATSPQDNATGVNSNHVILTFSEAVQAGSGNIVISGTNAGGLTDVRTIAVNDASQVTISGMTVDINPGADFLNGYSYNVQLGSGVITDLAGNAFAGIHSATTLNFTRGGGAATSPQTVLISEVNSNAGPADFFELYNYGTETVDLSGWKWDDDSASFNDAGSAAFAGGTTLAPGQRLVVAVGSDAAGFKSAWGLGNNTQVVAIGGPGLGNGDAVVLFNNAGHAVTGFNYSSVAKTASDGSVIPVAAAAPGVTFAAGHAGAAFGGTATTSAVWDGVSTAAPAYMAAAVGVNGGFAQPANSNNIGSPGVIAASAAPDTSAPTLVSVLPLDNASAASVSGNLVMTFSEAVVEGSGNIVITNTANGADTRSISVSDTAQVSFSGGVVSINPSADLLAGAEYAVTLASGVIQDAAGNPYAGISDSTTFNFRTAASIPTLLITEVNSNAGPADFFELYNYGAHSIDLSGWKWDDDSVSFTDPASASFASGTSIAPGARLVVVAGADAAGFKTAWGLGDATQVVATGGPGLGGGDAIALFNDGGAVVSSFNYSAGAKTASDGSSIPVSQASPGVTFVAGHAGLAFGGTATTSAVWDGMSLSNPTYKAAVVGVDGGFAQAAAAGNIGSPGSAPAFGAAGDLVFLAANADATDAFAFQVLKAVAAGAQIVFSDRNYSESTGMPASGESAYVWTADQAYDAGTIVTIQPDNTHPSADKGAVVGAGGGISSSAETIYAFTGAVAGLGNGAAGALTVESFLAAINLGGAAAGDIPASLVSAPGAYVSFTQEDVFYSGLAWQGAADAAAFRARVEDAGNWNLGDSPAHQLVNGSLYGAPAGITLISAIQGSGAVSPMVDSYVWVEAVVSAVTPGMSGFWLQEDAADSDGNAATSEGIFVYHATNTPGITAANVGDSVRLYGQVAEFNGLTELKNLSNVQVIRDGNSVDVPAAVSLTIPVVDYALWEQYEGMLVEVRAGSGDLTVTDNYNLGRYGQVTLSSGGILEQFTENAAPGIEGYAAFSDVTRMNQIILDDASSVQNPDPEVFARAGNDLSAANTLRAGDITPVIRGVLDQYATGSEPAYETTYRVQATQDPLFSGAARPTSGDLQTALGAAEIKVASVNVLNFFSTFGTANFTTPYGTAQAGRGADDATEYQRQLDKLLDNLFGLDADIYGLMEIQNNGFAEGSALDALVDAMNARAGSTRYAYIAGPFDDGDGVDEPSAGDDAIMAALVYDTTAVASVGQAVVPDTDVYDAFSAAYGNRVPLAQTFQSLTDGETFTVAVNHLKSKGSVIDADIGDGQGANNQARLEGVTDLTAWLATNPTGAPDGDILLIGDLNAYSLEDPVTYLANHGYTKLNDGLSYSFDGLWGSLDHALASASLTTQVVGAVEWAINAEEPSVLDYNSNFKSAGQISGFYAADEYRSSDHNPLLIGLNLSGGGADAAAPTPQSASVNGDQVLLTMSENLKPGALPGADTFSVNGGAITVTGVSLLGATLTLTLAAPVAHGDTISLGYNDPSNENDANALQDIAGNDAISFAGLDVVNHTAGLDLTAPTLLSSNPADAATNVAAGASLTLTFSEPIVKGAGAILIKRVADDSVFESIDVASSQVSIDGAQVSINPAANFALGAAYSLELPAGVFEDAAGNDFAGDSSLNFTTQAGTQVFISELHYDNTGSDLNEAVGVFGPAGTDLTGWSVVFYNGSDGKSYATLNLAGVIDNEGAGYGELSFNQSGIQNGAPDGLALVNASGQLIQFLSYEGSFAGVGGAADGITSANIGVSEAGTETAGLSLQLSGSGYFYENLLWNAPAVASMGWINPL